MAQTQLVFGFGSLINMASLLKTAPHAYDIRPSYVKGFRREFNLWAPSGSQAHLDLAGIPFCALDIRKYDDAESKVNGVLFTADQDCMKSLIKRERGYKLAETTVYDFGSDKPLGTCLLFSACKNDGSYDFKSPSQAKYLEVCMKGTKRYGEDFYQMFMDTSFVGDKCLNELPDLL